MINIKKANCEKLKQKKFYKTILLQNYAALLPEFVLVLSEIRSRKTHK